MASHALVLTGEAEALSPFQTPGLRYDCIYCGSASALFTVGFILAYAQQVLVEKFNVLSFIVTHSAHYSNHLSHTNIVLSPLPEGKHTGPDMCGPPQI